VESKATDEGLLDARTAIGLPTGGKNGGDLRGELLIGQGARAGVGLAVGPVVIAARGNFQGGAQGANGMLVFHRGDG